MKTGFVSSTQVQRGAKAVFSSDTPFQVVLSNSEVSGIAVNQAMAQALLASGVLDQLTEEYWEAHNKESVDLVQRRRAGESADSISLQNFRQNYAV